MSEEKEKKKYRDEPRAPDYVNRIEGTAAWVGMKDKNGNLYIVVTREGGKSRYTLFKNIPKDESRPPETSLTKGDWNTRS